ncbi:Dabb family protein [Flavicella marina]|uniref:Dabb family protein n=1 Tax=Flavicella marina TaxID=1475951 RepID=UPI0012641E26|nr:Dabb family protein [Flavicella marina]
MSFLKQTFLPLFFILSTLGFAQNIENASLFRKDFKAISGKNTVSITSYKIDESQFVFAGGVGNIDVYKLNSKGTLTAISNHSMYMEKGPARGIVADNIEGNDFLFVANKHGNVIETFSIAKDGKLKQVALLEDTDEMHLGTAITLQVTHIKNNAYLFVGGLEETPGLSSFKIEKNGKLTHIQSMKDDENIHTDGIIGMFTHTIKGRTYLYTSGFQDNGVSSFRIYNNGTFKNVNNIHDNTTDRYLTGAYPVTGVTLKKNKYVIVGHRHHKYYKRGGFIKNPDFTYHGDAVSVFKINSRGKLIPHHTFKDTDNTKLKGQTRIEVISQNENSAIIAVGTRDDASIQLLKLNSEGILSPVNYLETGYSIYYGLESISFEGKQFLIAGSNRFDMNKIVSYQVVPTIDREDKKLKHIVTLKYKAEASKEQVAAAVKAFYNLKNSIPEIADLEWGTNDSTEGHSKGFTHSFTLTFKNEHAREIYLFHTEHIKLVKQIGPIIDDVFVFDYWSE